MKKIYYNEEEREFYAIRQTPKMIFIDWISQFSGDVELDMGVMYKSLKIKKDNQGKHKLNQNDEDGILVYPNRSGQPYYFEPATKEHLDFEIAKCKKYGVSADYYEELLELFMKKKNNKEDYIDDIDLYVLVQKHKVKKETIKVLDKIIDEINK